ncbi:MAG: VOC family protein, partial [Planctomycetota bacterium]
MAVLDGFHHVALRSADFDRSIGFYTKVLGMTPAVAWGEGDNRA